MELKDFLQLSPGFNNLTSEDIHALEKSFSVEEYPDGHVFIEEHTKADAVYVVMEGEISAQHKLVNQPGKLELKRIHPGEIFGLMSIINNQARHTSCVAIGTAKVAALPASVFRLLYEKNSPVLHYFQHIIARQFARDYRAVAKALHKSIIEADQRKASLETATEYLDSERRSSIERRQAERRKNERRKDDRIHSATSL